MNGFVTEAWLWSSDESAEEKVSERCGLIVEWFDRKTGSVRALGKTYYLDQASLHHPKVPIHQPRILPTQPPTFPASHLLRPKIPILTPTLPPKILHTPRPPPQIAHTGNYHFPANPPILFEYTLLIEWRYLKSIIKSHETGFAPVSSFCVELEVADWQAAKQRVSRFMWRLIVEEMIKSRRRRVISRYWCKLCVAV